MQLRDLFKPDLMGNIAVYVDDISYTIQPCKLNPGMYKYRNRFEGTIWFTGDEEVIPILDRKDCCRYYIKKPEGDIRITKISCVAATAENLLLAHVMGGT